MIALLSVWEFLEKIIMDGENVLARTFRLYIVTGTRNIFTVEPFLTIIVLRVILFLSLQIDVWVCVCV